METLQLNNFHCTIRNPPIDERLRETATAHAHSRLSRRPSRGRGPWGHGIPSVLWVIAPWDPRGGTLLPPVTNQHLGNRLNLILR